MISPRTLVLVALLPATALAQVKSLEAARGARKTANEANAAIQQGADAVQEPAAAAQAPGDAGEPAPEGEAAAPGTLDVGAGEGAAAAADEGAGSVPAPDTYTVRPGDTLWDLSGRFLNNPWYWPKVWSYNPEITNPNWIYPGNVIRFYPSAEEAPARVEPVAEAAPEAQEPEAEAPRDLEDFSKADMKAPASADESDTVAVVGPYKIGYTAPKATLARDVTFVTAGELAQSGKLTGAFEEKIMLTALDRTYARFDGKAPVKKGESYLVYKTERPIYHPRTNELLGYQSTVLGTAKVTALDDTAVSLVITNALYPIERGALLGPWTDRIVRSVKRKPNQKALDGTIVATQYEVVTEIGEHHLVFVDRGKTDGVEVGNVFTVVRSGDPYGKPPKAPLREAGYPKEDVGDLLVIDAQDEVSTTLVVRSMRELAIGDEVEMRPAGGAGSN